MTTPKITFLGEPYPAPRVRRASNGRYTFKNRIAYHWSRLLAWTWKWTKRIAFVALVVGFLFGSYFMGTLNPKPSTNLTFLAAPPAYAGVDNTRTEIEIEVRKEALLDDMQACEYPHYNQATAIPTWDDNKAGTLPLKDKLSYGPMQFKISTMQRMYKKLHGVDLTNYEAMLKASNEKDARDVAIDAWIKIPQSINEWTCADEHMKNQVYKIRELQAKLTK